MRNLKRLVISVTFSAMLATMLIGTGGDAYAKTGTTTNQQGQNTGGQVTTPRTGGGLFQALGVTWE